MSTVNDQLLANGSGNECNGAGGGGGGGNDDVDDRVLLVQNGTSTTRTLSLRCHDGWLLSNVERMCAALQRNRTITSLELWIPSPEETTKEDTKEVGDLDYAFLTDLLARNDTIQRLTVLGALLPDKASAAILAGLQRNHAIAHLEWHASFDSIDDDDDAVAAWNEFFSTTTITVCSLLHSNDTSLCDAPMDATKHSSLLSGLRFNRSIRSLTVHQLEDGHVVADLFTALHDNVSLTQLSLTECNVSAVQSWPRWPALELLRLADCRLTPASLAAWSQSMALSSTTTSSCPLTRLDVRGNATFQSTESCRILQTILQSTTGLQKLVVEQCQLNDAGLHILLHPNDASPNNYLTKLQSLSLRDNDLVSVEGLACASLPSLQKLDLFDNALGGEESIGMAALVALIQCGTTPNLHHLVLESCQWTAGQVRDVCAAIGSTGRPWRHLNLGCNPAVGHVMADIAALLDAPTITDDGIKVLVQRLERDSRHQCTTSRLHDLALPWNQIGAAGVAHVSRWIRHNPRHGLHTLNVAFNSFDVATGLEELVDAVSYNCWMTKLQVTPFYGTGLVPNKMQQMHHWLRLNRAGRHHAVHHPEQVSTATWPLILARADQVYSVSALYAMLREAAPHWWLEP
jgi:hypothetical protein